MTKQVLNIFVKDDGLGYKKITIDNFKITSYLIPRSEIQEAILEEKLNVQAVYFLFGEDENGNSSCYIGKTNLVRNRLSDHDKKIFWNEAFVFIVEDADIEILEYLIINQAKKANRVKILNLVVPQLPNKSEKVYLISQNFLLQIKFILNVMGYNLLEELGGLAVAKSKFLEIYVKGIDWDAVGEFILDEQKVIVKSGSKVRRKVIDSFVEHPYNSIRTQLLDKGILVSSKNDLIFSQDYEFASTSLAGAIIRGASTNGWTAWKDKDGKTLDELFRKQSHV